MQSFPVLEGWSFWDGDISSVIARKHPVLFPGLTDPALLSFLRIVWEILIAFP